MSLAHAALDTLVSPAPGSLDQAERRRIGEYLLLRQSPGQAAGTWELLERSQEAVDWATQVRGGLASLYQADAPSLPGDDGDPAALRRSSAGASAPATLAQRRLTRDGQRRAAHIQIAVAQELSPFRQKAMDDYQEGQERVKLPHYASRPARISLNVLAVLLLCALAFCAVVKVPSYAEAKVLVTSLEDDAPGPQQGVSVVALFSPDTLDDLDTGMVLRVQLPETEERVSMELSFVEEDILSPQEVVDRYAVPDPQSRRVRDPAAVAVADLTVPDDAPSRGSFEGIVTEEANLRTGSRRIISLLF